MSYLAQYDEGMSGWAPADPALHLDYLIDKCSLETSK